MSVVAQYDPLIVDAFVRVHKEIALSNSRQVPRVVLSARSRVQLIYPALASKLHRSMTSHIAPTKCSHCMSSRRTLGGQAANDAGDVIASNLRRLISWSLCVFYIYDSTIDELEAKHAVGDGAPSARNRVPLGERV